MTRVTRSPDSELVVGSDSLADNSAKTAKPRGRPFRPGTSGNPGGRPKADPVLAAAFRKHAPDALTVLVTLMKRTSEPAIQLRAAVSILERGFDPHAVADESLRREVDLMLEKLSVALSPEQYERVLEILADEPRAARP